MYQAQWQSPSNIALIKYWGKHGKQLPKNPSISFTLSHANTITSVKCIGPNDNQTAQVEFLFEGEENPAFAQKIVKFLNTLSTDFYPFINEYKLLIESSNTFPHSSGIASSASSMSALALCLQDIHGQITGQDVQSLQFLQKASIVSRLGSGSASRSVFPHVAVWGQHANIENSSDEYAVGVEDIIHPIFHDFHDDILIVSPNEKSVSSTAGHQLMEGNPYSKARYQQAHERLTSLAHAMSSGDLDTFGKITEDEALTLHALMMCSDPSYILMEEGSLSVIKAIQKFRRETKIPVFFTLDAGPNVHVLYPHKYQSQVEIFVENELKKFCHNGKIIRDRVGKGPVKMA